MVSRIGRRTKTRKQKKARKKARKKALSPSSLALTTRLTKWEISPGANACLWFSRFRVLTANQFESIPAQCDRAGESFPGWFASTESDRMGYESALSETWHCSLSSFPGRCPPLAP